MLRFFRILGQDINQIIKRWPVFRIVRPTYKVQQNPVNATAAFVLQFIS